MIENLSHIESRNGPPKRQKLRGMIYMHGYDSLSGFTKEAGMAPSVLSRVLSGWHFPGISLQTRLARTLGMNLRDLRKLL